MSARARARRASPAEAGSAAAHRRPRSPRPVDDRVQPLGSLGVVRRGHVLEEALVRHEQEPHESNATFMEVVRFARRLSVPDLVLHAGGAAVRVRPWPGDTATAQVLPLPGSMLPSPQEVQRWLHGLTRLGYDRARTAALGARDLAPYQEAGMDPWEELALLRRVLDSPVEAPPRTVRRVSRRGWAELSAIDAAAFPPGSQLDEDAILDACRATPRHRVRLAVDPSPGPASPAAHRAGTDATEDDAARARDRHRSLHRLRRQRPCRHDRIRAAIGRAPRLGRPRLGRLARARRPALDRAYGCVDALVNTHVGNHRALALYERLGFRRLPEQLTVLGTALADAVMTGRQVPTRTTAP